MYISKKTNKKLRRIFGREQGAMLSDERTYTEVRKRREKQLQRSNLAKRQAKEVEK